MEGTLDEYKKYLSETDLSQIQLKTGYTILHLLALSSSLVIQQNLDMLYNLVLERIPQNDPILNLCSKNKLHPLYLLCKKASKEIITAFIEKGADPKIAGCDISCDIDKFFQQTKSKPQRHAFAAALKNPLLSESDLMELMELFFGKYKISPYSLTENNDSLLHLTVMNINLMKKAAEYQSSFDIINIFGEKPLHCYCMQQNTDIKDFLYVFNQTNNPYSKTHPLKETFLHFLAYNNARGLFYYCFKKYPELNTPNRYNITPLEFFNDFKAAYEKFEANRVKIREYHKEKSTNQIFIMPKKFMNEYEDENSIKL